MFEPKTVAIPDKVTRIDKNAFNGCSSLTKITLPKGVTEIGNSAFSGCEKLSSIALPEGLKAIGTEAFREAKSLTSIVLPEKLETLGEGIFYDDTSLASVTWPTSLKSVPENTFYGCTGLTSFDFSKITESIGDSAFSKSGLKEVVLPEGLTSIGYRSFSDSASLKKVVIPSSVNEIGTGAFTSCASLSDFTNNSTITTGPNNFLSFSGIETIDAKIINKEMTSTSFYAFQRNEKLKTVEIPGTLKEIGGSAFMECPNLTSLTLEEGVEKIGTTAFQKDIGLEKKEAVIYLPKSLQSIGANAFSKFKEGSTSEYVLMVLKNVHYAGTKAELEVLKPEAAFGVGSTIACSDGTVTI